MRSEIETIFIAVNDEDISKTCRNQKNVGEKIQFPHHPSAYFDGKRC